MLEPDDHTSDALVWDYEDLFRVVGDALHATGHDKEALRFYEPLYFTPVTRTWKRMKKRNRSFPY
jgi:hypothetical protein